MHKSALTQILYNTIPILLIRQMCSKPLTD